jgi:hypothetical protein
VRKRKGATGPNADILEDDKIYVRKKLIIKDRENWIYRQSKVLGLLKDHPNIITLHGMVLSSPEKVAEGRLPDFLFDYVETKDNIPLKKKTKGTT